MMRKYIGLIAVIMMIAALCQAGMDNRDYTVSVITVTTNSQSYVLRGTLYGVYVDAPANKTGTVTVASDETTLFTKSITADGMYYPRAAMHTTAGAAATWNAYSGTYALTTTTNSWITYSGTNDETQLGTNSVISYAVVPTDGASAQTIYGEQVMAGAVSVTVVGAAGTVGTNAWAVTLIYEK